MPAKTDSLGSLEISDSTISQEFLTKLNSRLRSIGHLVGSSSSTSTTTSSGGTVSQLQLDAPGPLAIQSNVAPITTLPASKSFTNALVFLKQPPIGGSVSLQLYVGGTAYGPLLSLTGTSLTIPLGGVGPIAANAIIRLDVVNVPSDFPGADLSVILR